MIPNDVLLHLEDVVKRFPAGRGEYVHAVDGVSFDLKRGETLGLVGESGCGKSTLGRLFSRLEEPTSGRIVFDGTDVTALSPRELRDLRPRIQIIFQDPFSSLNPHKTVGQIVSLPLRIKARSSAPVAEGVQVKAVQVNALQARRLQVKAVQVKRRVAELLRLVGLEAAHANRFPHQFSGGQRQRIGIARALAAEPDLIVADEPVASLDVSIQAQILQVLRRLQEQFELTLLFISHDLSVVSHVSHRIAVMYLGKIVEIGPAQSVIETPLHPYTQALLESVPRIEPERHEVRVRLSGDVPSPIHVPSGCRFHTRCPLEITDDCRTLEPPLRELAPSHLTACHLAPGVGKQRV